MSEVYYNSELVMIMSMLDQHQKPVFSFFWSLKHNLNKIAEQDAFTFLMSEM